MVELNAVEDFNDSEKSFFYFQPSKMELALVKSAYAIQILRPEKPITGIILSKISLIRLRITYDTKPPTQSSKLAFS